MKKEIELGKLGGQGRWATVLEVPIDLGGQGFLVGKRFGIRLTNGCFHRKHLKIQQGWSKIQKTNGAVNWDILLVVEVGFAALGVIAMCYLLVMVVEQMVDFLQGNSLKDQHR